MKQVYLDNAATTPVRLEVEVAMRPYFCEKYGNPSGVYQMSSENRGMIENVREQIAKTLNASAEEIYFTSGGTESDNWAIKAAAQMLKEKGRHIITSKIEHHAILNSCAYLEKQGFETERGYCDLPTSFKAVKKGTGKGPVVAFLAEYDALRGVGHGCGHNVIATCASGAFASLAKIFVEMGIAGEVRIIGTPAEEGGAGKAIMLERGGFDGVDFALMIHPTCGGESRNYINRNGRASGSLTISFTGQSAHSSAPATGINALTAAISVFNQIDMLRPLFETEDNVNGVILEGGTASNIIPGFSKSEFCIRAATMKRIDELQNMIIGCAKRAESLTGAKVQIQSEPIYAERYPCLPICEDFKENMARVGISMCLPDPKLLFGSSDIGNVSIKIPAIHDYLSITDEEIPAHSKEYAKAAAEPAADEICIKGAQGLAMTGLDLLLDESLRQAAAEYHEKVVPDFYKEK